MEGALRRWKSIQLFGWVGFIVYMVLTGRDESYLAPLQHQILLAGGGLLFLVLVADLTGKSSDGGRSVGWRNHLALGVESLGHWTPLIVVALIGVTTLNMDAATLRNSIQMRVFDPNRVPEDLEDKLANLNPGDYLEINHIQLYSHEALASEAPVALTGRIGRLRADQMREALPSWDKEEGVMLLYRFAIACCAADATPLAVVLEGLPPETSFTEEGWFQVRGVTRTLSDDSHLIAIRVDHFEAIPVPDKPYLSWLDVM